MAKIRSTIMGGYIVWNVHYLDCFLSKYESRLALFPFRLGSLLNLLQTCNFFVNPKSNDVKSEKREGNSDANKDEVCIYLR
jgi:hypothetical protein